MLNELIEQLKNERNFLQSTKEDIENAENMINQTQLGKALETLKGVLKKSQEQTLQLETKIREEAITEYVITNNKYPHSKVEIKLFTIVTIKDEKKAMAWAVENDPSALKLSTAKLASDTKNLELDFLKKSEEPRAQIASKLD